MSSKHAWSFKALASGQDDADAPHGWVEGCANAAIVDRYDELVLPAALAAAVPAFLQNPVLSFGHGIDGNPTNGTLPAGRVLKLWQDAQGNTMFRARWANTPEAQMVRGLYQDGDMRGFSVQFIPLEQRPPTPEELTKWPTLRRVITKLDLIEIACAVVPVNPGSLATAAKSLAAVRRLAIPQEGPVEQPMNDEQLGMVAELVKAYNANAEAMAGTATALEELQAKAAEGAGHGERMKALLACHKQLTDACAMMGTGCTGLAKALGVEIEVNVGEGEADADEQMGEGDQAPAMDEEQAKSLADQVSKALSAPR